MSQLEARPRFSKTRDENVFLISKQLINAGRAVDAVEFAHLVKVLEGQRIDQHPISAAAEKLGMTVQWVN